MLKLNIKTEPYWIELPGAVKVKVTPISTAIMSAAQTMAIDAYRLLSDSQQVDPSNDAMRKGLSESLLVRSLAQLAILEWEGVMQAENDDLAPVNEKTVSDLMNIWLIAQEFLKSYVTQFKLLEIEGNVLAPAATGTLAEEAPTAASAA